MDNDARGGILQILHWEREHMSKEKGQTVFTSWSKIHGKMESLITNVSSMDISLHIKSECVHLCTVTYLHTCMHIHILYTHIE